MKQNIKYFINGVLSAGLILTFGLFLFSPSVFAQSSCPAGCPPGQCYIGGKCVLANPAPKYLVSTNDFGQLLKDIITYFLYFAGAIAIVFLMVGGFQYISSRGNEEAMEKAKKTITAAIIGIVLIVMSFAIVAIINTLLTQPPPSSTAP